MVYILLGVHYFKHIRKKVSDHFPISYLDSVFTLTAYAQMQLLNRPHLNSRYNNSFLGLCYLTSLNTLTGRAVSQSWQVTRYVTVLCVSHHFLTSLFPGQQSRDYENSSGHSWTFFRNNFTGVCTIDGFHEAQHS